MIARDVQPFSVVTDNGFKDLVEYYDQRYKMPSKTYFRDKMLPSEYQSLKSKLMSILANTEHISVRTDGWTSRANEGYITVTCHFIHSNFSMKSAVQPITLPPMLRRHYRTFF